jgi:predicted phosphoribosyltransferase
LRGERRYPERPVAESELAALTPVLKPPCVVASIPRGGVAVALPIVERLHLPLTVVYARKLTAPVAPELAFGAIDEDDQATVDAACVAMLELSSTDIEQAKHTADRFVSLLVDPNFAAVGGYYRDFSPVSDAQVIAMLTAHGTQSAVSST